MEKLCTKCRHFRNYILGQDCMHPDTMRKGVIAGKVSYPSPRVNRGVVSHDYMFIIDPDSNEKIFVDAKCGKEGKLFSPKGTGSLGAN